MGASDFPEIVCELDIVVIMLGCEKPCLLADEMG
jgi:hypothetical protein